MLPGMQKAVTAYLASKGHSTEEINQELQQKGYSLPSAGSAAGGQEDPPADAQQQNLKTGLMVLAGLAVAGLILYFIFRK